MNAVLAYAAVLGVVVVAGALFALTGSLVRAFISPRAEPLGNGAAVATIVLDAATGMAIFACFGFAAGIAGLLYPATFFVGLAAIVAASGRLAFPMWTATFWRGRFAVVRRAVSPAVVLILVAAVVIGFEAAIPDPGSDATTYHMVYAVDWAHAHALSVDPWIRAPYYANNWLLLDAWLISLGGEIFGSALTLLAGTLSLLGIFAYVLVMSDEGSQRARLPVMVAGLLAAAALALCPAFLSVVDLAVVDVPMGFVFLACVLSIAMTLRRREAIYPVQLLLCGAFLIGMKISLIAFFPLLAVALGIALVGIGASRRRIAMALLIFTVLASPWYVKNFVQAGDPIAPTLNLALHGVDPHWSRADAQGALSDLKSHEGGPLARMAIPFDLAMEPAAWQYRVPGVTLLVLLIGVPGLVAAFALVRRERMNIDAATVAAAAMIVYAVGYWTATSYLGRYALLFYPALAAFAGGLAVTALGRFPRVIWAAPALMLFFALPSAASTPYYGIVARVNGDFERNYHDRETWLEPRMFDYPAVETVSALIQRKHRTDLRVYRTFINVDRLYFKDRGITVLGDNFGPDRFADLEHAVFADELAAYVARFKIGAFVVPEESFGQDSDMLRDGLAQKATALGFKRLDFPGGRAAAYISPALQ